MTTFNKLKLSIVTPEGTAFTDEVDMVIIPGAEGKLGILPNHIPVFTRLVPGELAIKKGDEEIPLAVAGGFANILPDRVIVLTDLAIRAEEINALKAAEAKRKAEQAMREKRSGKDFAVAEASLRRAIVELQMARKYRKHREA